MEHHENASTPSLKLEDLEPTGVDMLTGRPVWREFTSIAHWVAKASSWVSEGDVCIDAKGHVLKTGRDFETAVYPVTIARPRQGGAG